MKLMGASRLFRFAGGASRPVGGACAALYSELEAGNWKRRSDVVASFPFAAWDDGRLVVPLDKTVCCVVAFNYRSGIALIESVGHLDSSAQAPAGKRSQGR
jgi:hypothetical protein